MTTQFYILHYTDCQKKENRNFQRKGFHVWHFSITNENKSITFIVFQHDKNKNWIKQLAKLLFIFCSSISHCIKQSFEFNNKWNKIENNIFLLLLKFIVVSLCENPLKSGFKKRLFLHWKCWICVFVIVVREKE